MREDLDKIINSEKDLNFLLEKHNLKRYVGHKCHFNDIIEVCPELLNCLSNKSSFSAEKINGLLGENFLTFGDRLSSFTMNVIINKFKEKNIENN